MGEGSKPKKKTVSTRLPADDHDRLKAYCDEQEISQADALRRFITDSLDREHGDRNVTRMSAPTGRFERIAGTALLLILALLAGGYLL
jgi:hypothetical protein